jgi:TRAP-type uncharacterized transport system fused permease subunit
MGVVGKGELLAALYTATYMFVLLLAVFLYFKYVLKDPTLKQQTLFGNIRLAIETHADMTSYLTLLLATLGIMIGLFTVTGFINRMGAILVDLGSWNVGAMILMAWVFGWLAGAGLPPTATYIIGAVVIVRPLQQFGVDPWVAHFFVFLLSVWGELSPPTSLTAAVSARIANASFLKTMYDALKICAPITLMTFAIFSRSNMVVNPGWLQVGDTILVLIATLGVTVAMFARVLKNPTGDLALRLLLAAIAFVTMFHPSTAVSAAVAIVVLAAVIAGILRNQRFAAPAAAPVSATGAAVTERELSPLLKEAGREIG